MVVKIQHIQLYGIDEVLAPVIDDLKTLKKVWVSMVIINMLFNSRHLTYVTRQDGSNIGDEVFRSTLTVVSADNLASQLIGGYKVLNSAFKKCRYCMATDEQIKARLAHLYYRDSEFCIMFMITAPEFTKTNLAVN